MQEDRLAELKGILQELKSVHGLEIEQVAELVNIDEVPASLYMNRNLGVMELTVRYLKEQGMRYNQIAAMLNRDQRTVWVMYNKAVEKQPVALPTAHSDIFIPLSIFRDRQMGTMLAIVTYLKEVRGMRFADIGRLLNRDPRIVCTIYHTKH